MNNVTLTERTMARLWPPNSPDLNPVDYKVWGVIQHRVYDYLTRVHNVDEPKQRLVEVWAGLQQKVNAALAKAAQGFHSCKGTTLQTFDVDYRNGRTNKHSIYLELKCFSDFLLTFKF